MVIVRAAIMFANGEIVEGHDYGHAIGMANKLSLNGDKLYGFVNGAGDFVLPDEAAQIALESGQITSPVDKLSPEDIWPEYVGE